MQIIFLLLISSFVYAQKNSPGIQCDPKELENQCYSLLCDSTSSQLISSDSEELVLKAQAQPFTINNQMKANLESLAKVSENIKASVRKKLTPEEIDKLTTELMQSPFEALKYMKLLFSGDISCVMENGSCQLVVNDLVSYPEGMKTLFKKLSEDTIKFDYDSPVSLDEKKKKMISGLEKLSGKLNKDQIKAEKRKINRIRTEGEFMIYAMASIWHDDYESLISSQIAPYKNDLSAALKTKMEDMVSIDLSSPAALERVQRSCQVANYIHVTIAENSTQKKFDEEVEKVISSFKTKFLPKLSTSSAAEMSRTINGYSFNLLRPTGSIYPGSPLLGRHYSGHNEPKDAFELLQDLNVLKLGENYGCRVTSNTVNDHYNPNNEGIYISSYVLANNLSDVITHELGHWFSHQHQDGNMSSHSSRKIRDVRKCVKGFYPKDRSKGVYRGDHSRTEEDFADWFSAKAGLGNPKMWCDLKKVLKKTPGSDFIPEDGDSHSNILFREIVLRMNRGESLPGPCKELIEAIPEIEPRNCEM